MRCMSCGSPLTRRELARCDLQVIGYERRRQGGVLNHLIGKTRTGKVRCWTCSQIADLEDEPVQTSLFDEV